MSIKMTRGRILIHKDAPEEKVGSIYIPETSQQRPKCGMAIVVGPGVDEVRPGDKVHYSDRGRPAFTINGKLYQIIAEADVFGVEE